MSHQIELGNETDNLADMNVLDAAIFSHAPDSALLRHKNQNISILKSLKDKIKIGNIKIKEVVEKRMHRSVLYTFLVNASLLATVTISSLILGKATNIHLFYLVTVMGGLFSLFNIIAAIALSPFNDFNYKWLVKKCLNTPLLDNLNQDQKKYQQQVHNIIVSKQFQHAYLTHILLNIKNLNDVMEDIRQKNRLEDYNLVIELAHKLNHYRIVQNNLIELWSNKQENLEKDEKILNTVLELEESLIYMNKKIAGNPETKKHQQEFMFEHQKFLESQGLSYLLDCGPTSEQLEQCL
jgi:hypothetical protein